MKTAIVILNWNTEDYLRRFLPALLESCEGMDAEVVVADSASSDGSLRVLADEFPAVKAIPLDANYGFTGGYNRALVQVEAEYYVLLNSDIEVPRGWLRPLVEWMDEHPDCGVCGPKLHKLIPAAGTGYSRSSEFEYAGAAGGWLDRYGYPFCRGRVLKRTAKDEGQYDNPQDVMWVSGACLMTRSSLWRELGGLDGRFFAHMEEIDYCWRAQLAGWRVTVVPESVVYHIGGGTLPQESPFKLKLNYRNNLLLLDNNLAATIGCQKARRRIAIRKLLDLGSALVYLLTGRAACCKAVLDAHREYRTLRCARQHSAEVRPEWVRLRDEGAQRLSQNVGTEGAASVNANGLEGAASVNAAAPDERRTSGRPNGRKCVTGLLPVRILLQAAIRKEKIFNYLTKYEGSH